MSTLTMQGIALVLMLLASPLTSAGTTTDTTWLNIAGLAVLALGALVPPVLRYAGPSDDDGEDEGDGDGEPEPSAKGDGSNQDR